MGQLPDSTPDWLHQIGVLVGGGGIGAVGLAVVNWLSGRGKVKEDSIYRYAETLRKDYVALQVRYEAKEKELNITEQERDKYYRVMVAQETENRLLRSRYHRIRNYVQHVYEEVSRKLNLPTGDMGGIPEWVDEDIPMITTPKIIDPPPPLPMKNED